MATLTEERLAEIRAALERYEREWMETWSGLPSSVTSLGDAGLELLAEIERLTAERDGWRRRAEDACPRHERLLGQFKEDKRVAELAAYDQLNRADTLRVERDALRAALAWAVEWMEAYEGECMPEWREWQQRGRRALRGGATA